MHISCKKLCPPNESRYLSNKHQYHDIYKKGSLRIQIGIFGECVASSRVEGHQPDSSDPNERRGLI